jgi:hypothetical protein
MKYIETGTYRSDSKRRLLIEVSDEDYDELSKYHWHVDINGGVSGRPNKVRTLMHRYIMKPNINEEVDHIDGNRMNNQRSNLRIATSSQNKMNRGPRKDNTSGYKGVSWHSQNNKWTARIKAGDKYLHLGLFDNIEDAKNAYNKSAIELHKEFAWIN